MLVVHPTSRVLCINSGAGGLLIAAKHLGYPVIGSYHVDLVDGLDVQQANIDLVDYRATEDAWPPPKKKGLHGVVALSHQPSAHVLEYTLSQGVDALLIEAATTVEVGGRSLHNDAAERYGYQVYRILQNAATFKIPQWRPRFWAVFIHKRFEFPWFMVTHQPEPAIVRDILEESPSAMCDGLGAKFAQQWALICDTLGPKVAEDFLKRCKYGPGMLPRLMGKHLDYNHDQIKALMLPGTGQKGGRLRILDPDQCAPALLDHSFWTIDGRSLSGVEYNRIMGFPDHYQFPANAHRQYLSNGVCPPVAMWILDVVERNLHQPQSFYTNSRYHHTKPATFTLKPGETADIQPTKAMWDQIINERERFV